MKLFTVLALMLLGLKAFCQDQQGYYITADGQKVEGFFKTSDFYNPATIEFRKNNEEPYVKLATDPVVEYGINGEFRFRKFNVSTAAVPAGQEVFLNTVTEGNATLYSFFDGSSTTFYYTVEDKYQSPVALQYVKTRLSQRRNPENNRFREQLQADVNCGNQGAEQFSRIRYSERALADVFIAHNQCKGSAVTTYANSSAKTTRFHITAFAGAYNTTFNIENLNPAFADANVFTFGLGFEAAYRLPSDNFELFSKLEFESVSAGITRDFVRPDGIESQFYDLDATIFSLHLGPRYYFKINSAHKIFVDGALAISVPFGEMQEYMVLMQGNTMTNFPGTEHDLDTVLSGNFGIGYVFRNKFGVDVRYETNRELFTIRNNGYAAELGRIGVNVRYTFN